MKTTSAAWVSLFIITLGFHAAYCVSNKRCIPPENCHWFYLNKILQCFCKDGDACNESDGDCSPKGCDRFHFGPGCQHTFVDTNIAKVSRGAQWLLDKNDSTCNTHEGRISETVAFRPYFPLTWLRIVAKDKHAFNKLTIKYETVDSTLRDCSKKISSVNNQILDFVCGSRSNVKRIILSGKGLQKVCSLYISSGRNMALKPNSNSAYAAAFDGSYPGRDASENDLNRYCIGKNKAINKLNIGMIKLKVKVTGIRIFNIWDPVSSDFSRQLNGATIKGYFVGKQIFAIQIQNFNSDHKDFWPRTRYTGDVDRLELEASNRASIELCELEVLGEPECDSDHSGFDCSEPCNCDPHSKCFASTGGCPYENSNDECRLGTYGDHCQYNCSSNCAGYLSLCDVENGTCFDGCQHGYRKPNCEEKCANGTYGYLCRENCSTFCWDEQCNNVNGECLNCTEGRRGDFCENIDEGYGSGDSKASSEVIIFIIIIGSVVVLVALVQVLQSDNADPAEVKPTQIEVDELKTKAISRSDATNPKTEFDSDCVTTNPRERAFSTQSENGDKKERKISDVEEDVE